jgi:ketosteroid isomerase-like protein
MVFRPVLVLALLAVTSNALAQAPASPLLELTKQYLAAAKARDAAKVATFYAEDAVLMPPNAPPVKGRKAIQQDHERLFKESPSFQLTATPLASETSGELGYIQGEFVVQQQGGGEVRGKYVEVWRRIKGEWKILYDINNANHPPAAPTPPTPPMPPTPPQE